MGKLILLFTIMAALVSCNFNHDTVRHNDAKIKDSSSISKKLLQKDTVYEGGKAISTGKLKNGTSKELLGIWILKGAENATFDIRNSTIYYPDQSVSYKYEIVGDSIRIHYDGFNQSFAYKLKGSDTLLLNGEDGENAYYRVKK